MSEYIAPRSRARIFINWLAGALVALLVVGGFSAPAMAAGGKVTVFPASSNGQDHNGMPVMPGGDTFNFQLGYGSMDDGAVSVITLPEGVTIPAEALVVPAGNTAVKSLEMNAAGQLVITFAAKFPSDVNQGVLDLKFTVEKVEHSDVRELNWDVDGVSTSQTIIVTKPGDKPSSTNDSAEKSVENPKIKHTIVDGKVVIDESVLGTKIPYTVTVKSKQARDVVLTDTLGKHLALVEGSLKGSKVVRDENDLNPVTTSLEALPNISGESFTYGFSAEANSVYTFTYEATIADAAALAAVRDELQAAYDTVAKKEDGGDYSIKLSNGADVSGTEVKANVWITGNVAPEARPGVGEAFTKSVEPSNVDLKEQLTGGDTLAKPIDLTYTLVADLTKFADFSTNEKYKLKNNVVIKDMLPETVAWDISGKGTFLTLTDAAGDEIKLTPADALKGDVEKLIASDDYKFHYVVDGQNLFVNVGKDVKEKYTLTVKATLTQLPADAFDKNGIYIDRYLARNTANFVYGDGKYHGTHADTVVTTPKDLSGGVDDKDKFKKSATGGTLTAVAGTSVEVPYQFNVGAGVGNALTSRIIDAVDHSIFNVTEETLPQIKASITGKYDWNYPLDGDTFDLSIDKEGNLVIAPNSAFPKDARWGAAEAPMNKAWEIEFKLPTHVLKGKQTLDIKNAASYEGTDLEYTFTSSSQTKATSFGNEMEVQKRVYDAKNDAFTTNLRAETDESGKLLKDTFVYRVELMPHGTFSNMVEPVTDVLPEGVEFVGFVAPEDVKGDRVDSNSSYRVPGSNLTATFDATANTVTLEKGKLESGKTVSLFFKVKLVGAKENIGVTNLIGTSGATITPTNDYPLSLLKRDSADATKLITDKSAVFSVLAADKQTVVLSDLRVENGKIVTATGGTPVVKQPGTYWLREDVAPGGYKKSDELLEIGFKADDSAKEVVLFNDRQNYAIGDLTWIDTNRDGIQDEGEPVLSGVTVELIQGGKVIATTKTDADGRYLFDELPAGEYQVKFTLTEEQQKLYTFTTQNSGKDGAADSDADRETGLTTKIVLGDSNTNLTKSYDHGKVKATEGIDPTWDAGVVLKSYAIGDYTWIDENNNGVQDEGEEILPGVTVELIKDGKVIDSKVTDKNGLYRFDDLPAGEYQVKFTLTKEQQKEFRFTEQTAGSDDALDSNANPETGLTTTIVLGDSNKNLTKDPKFGELKATEGIDPTWDAGVIRKTYAIGDYTWIDANRDGIQDADEEILAGVTVELIKDGEVVKTTTTDENGRYVFDGLKTGEYQVKFTLTPEQQKIYTFTDLAAGEDDGADSNAERGTGLTTTIVLGDDNANLTKKYDYAELDATEGIDPTWDAGVVLKTYAIGDFTWIDANRDGIQDADEEILAGVTVELMKDGEVVKTTTTDETGHYMFDNLYAGEYEVKFTLTDEQKKVYTFTSQVIGENGAVDSNADRKTGLTTKIVLDDSNPGLTKDYPFGTVEATEGIDPTWDAGVVVKTYAVGDVVWIDANKNGVQDSSEKVLPGVTVELFQNGKVIATTTTDKNGRYKFDDLNAGEYQVKFTLTKEQQKIYKFTKPTVGSNGAVDSNAHPETGFTATIVLGDDNSDLTTEYEFGEVNATEGIDPTWDAGVVVIDIPATEVPGAENPGTPGVNELPNTGGSLPLLVGGVASLLLLAGASLMIWRRRTA
ncbi:LPXTG-motif cell wall-anchored protein [Leucobacter komagatae]|uniref:LPXTG-motif cell wall-anchored protein n=1 Tax=Leucobacter komagatae TaxID=55969 RepID=A0A542Y8A3_9MICO|nr:SdrD B-like domain-containing protein [Leucobacter komagatae]TQL44224.1 LPXTG-motif cell wall-anchored protein [Leucobacter komagatae]